MSRFPRERTINSDETDRRTVAAGFLTWAAKGSECLPVQIDNDDTERVTVIATIDAGENKLALTIVGKGNTKRCLAGFQLPGDVWGIFSDFGWTTLAVMAPDLHQLRQGVFPGRPILLLLEISATHRSAEVRAVARDLGIDLVFISPGCTGRMQALDRSGVRRIWREHYHRTHRRKVTNAMIVERPADDEGCDLDDDEYRQFIKVYDLMYL